MGVAIRRPLEQTSHFWVGNVHHDALTAFCETAVCNVGGVEIRPPLVHASHFRVDNVQHDDRHGEVACGLLEERYLYYEGTDFGRQLVQIHRFLVGECAP